MKKIWSDGFSFTKIFSFTHLLYALTGAFGTAIFFIYFYGTGSAGTIEIVRTFASLFIVISIVLTAFQFNFNRGWNRKEVAIKALHESSKIIKENNKIIDPVLQTNSKIEHDDILSIKDIHNAMGVFLKSGKFIFHGEETQADIMRIHDKDESGYIQNFTDGKNGRKIDSAITDILNEFEYICMSCNLNIFDKKTVIELRGVGIIKTFNLFSNYIYHKRQDIRHNYGERLYEHFEKFAHEVERDLRGKGYDVPQVRKPKALDFTTPFPLP